MAKIQIVTRNGMIRGSSKAPRLVTPTASTGDTQPPAAVTGFRTTSGSVSPTLVWTNPTGDFTGTLILRRQGTTAPTLVDGVSIRVADVGAPGTTWTDSGLIADTTYVYAAFSHDARPNFGPAATWTFTTDANEVGGLRPYWGSSAEAANYADSVVVYEQMFNWVGQPGEVRRLFTSSFSTSMTAIDSEIAAGRIPHWSTFHSTTGNYSTLAGLLAARDAEIFVTYFHEPENDFKGQGPGKFPQDYQDEFVEFYDVMKAEAGPKVHVGPILMRDTWVNQAKDPMDWLVPGKMDFVGVDCYNSLGKLSFQKLLEGPLLTAEQLNKPLIVGETGTHGYPPGATNTLGFNEATVYRYRWMEEATRWLETDPRAQRVIAIQWFSSTEGMRAGPAGWAIQRSLNPMVIQDNPEGTPTAYGTVVNEFTTAQRLGTHMAKPKRALNWYDGTATPSNITNLTATLTTTSVQLNWTNPAGSDGTFIRRATGATPPTISTGTLLTDAAAGVATYTDTGRTPGTQYSYSLFAHNAADIPSARRTITVTVPSTSDQIPPGPVTNILLAGLGEDFVGFTWTKPSDLDYAATEIYKNGVYLADVTAPGYAYIAGSLTPFTDYLFELYAKDAAGNKSAATEFFIRTDKASAGITRPLWGLGPDGGGLTTGSEDLYEAVQVKVGQPLEGMRIAATSFSASPSVLTREATAGRTPFYSTRFSTPANYAALATFIDGLGIEIYLTAVHEPEISPTVLNAADFKTKFDEFYAAFEAYPDIHVGPVFLRSTFASTSAYAPIENWFPTKMDFLGVDMYSQGNATPTELMSLPMDKAEVLDLPLVVAEVSVKGNPDERAEWVRQFTTLLEQPEYFRVKACYWAHLGTGAGAQPGGWYLDRALPYTPPGWKLIDTNDLPPDPVVAQRGALAIGTADYPVPGNAIYISPGGADTFNGTTPGTAVKTLVKAVSLAGSNGTICMLSGTYKEQYWLSPNVVNLTIQNAPGATAWFDGSDNVATNQWTAQDGFWKVSGWKQFSHATVSGLVDDVNFPLAAWPEQVWYDGTRLTHVETKGELGPLKFWVEENTQAAGQPASNTIWIGSPPSGHTVDVTARQHALQMSSNTTVRGVGFRRYATPSTSVVAAVSMQNATLTAENNHFLHNSASGLFAQQTSSGFIRRNTFDGNGQMGLRGFHAAGLFVEQNEFKWNNWKRFSSSGAAGGMKIDTNCNNATLARNWVHDNWGHGLWVDIDSANAKFVQNLSHNNVSSGLFFEISETAMFIGNIIYNCGHGIFTAGSKNIRMYNNTIRNCQNPLNYSTDGRRPTIYGNINFYNNIVSQDTPLLTANAITAVDPGNNDTKTPTLLGAMADYNAVWRRSTTSNNYAKVSNGSGSTTLYTSLAALQAAQAWADNDIERTGGSEPFVALDGTFTPTALVKTAGTTIPADMLAELVGWSDAQKADPPIGAVPDPALA